MPPPKKFQQNYRRNEIQRIVHLRRAVFPELINNAAATIDPATSRGRSVKNSGLPG
jgi:hypothetical protein